ncbi:FadR/GntR family transcriptional regulator [Glutamicibacter sp. AOP38-B1-38]|uniref:FadR/GntR family transcriptional regulator n=1 Tax=Glutamicibacter sp. AOP38-B1-38 TaxID=3457680 RepID=UPI004033C334
MSRKSLVTQVADGVLDRIIGGELAVDELIPGELELCAALDVSRMTVREAIKILAAQNIIRVERGRGTYVNPVGMWSSLEAVLRATTEGVGAAAAAVQLIELRRMLETGACELAAGKISDAQLARLDELVAEMKAAHQEGGLDRFVEADLEFHDQILRASGNVFVAALFEPLGRVLASRRRETSAFPQIQAHAIAEHEKIRKALGQRDSARAREAMDGHMRQTLEDLNTFVLQQQAGRD